jgi:hypothetical protein
MILDTSLPRLLPDDRKSIYIPEALRNDVDLLGNVQRLCETMEELTARLNDAGLPAPSTDAALEAAEPETLESKALHVAKLGVAVRRRREKVFGEGLFSEPVWDILLDLFIARCEGIDVTVGNACLAASVPMTSALRYCQTLLDRGIVYRERDRKDGRRIFLRMSESAFAKITALLGQDTPPTNRLAGASLR